jgi:hypothetical protein
VAPGATCSISITFAPTIQSPFFGQITIHDDAAIPVQSFPLQGTGSFPQPLGFIIADAASGSSEIPAQTVTAGGTAAFNLSVVPDAGFSAPASFTCSGAPPGGRCSLSPASFNLSGPTNVVLSVSTGSSSAATHASKTFYAALFASVLGLPLILLGGGGRRRGQIAPLCVAFLLVLCLTSCGGGGSAGGGGGGGPTPPGDYNLTVSGTAGSAQGTVAVTLTVK